MNISITPAVEKTEPKPLKAAKALSVRPASEQAEGV